MGERFSRKSQLVVFRRFRISCFFPSIFHHYPSFLLYAIAVPCLNPITLGFCYFSTPELLHHERLRKKGRRRSFSSCAAEEFRAHAHKNAR